MKLFPTLPILEDLKQFADIGRNYNNVYVVSVQHILETTGSLFEAVLDIGIKPENIYLIGKIYSTHYKTLSTIQSMGIRVFNNTYPERFGTLRECLKKDIAFMWETIKPKLQKKDVVIILDDGGLAIKKAPRELFDICRFYGIEQTTFGLRYQENIDHFPIIQVATSAAKKFLEPCLISTALTKKISKLLNEIKPKSIGVVGFGNIGKAVAYHLSNKYQIFVYDITQPKLILNVEHLSFCSDLKELIQKCELIISATGIDISNFPLDSIITTEKTFISVSSSDIEFNSLLKEYNDDLIYKNYSLLDNLVIRLPNNASIKLYRGGTVANFDGSKESCPKEQIQLTRGLLFAGILQALNNNIHLTDENGSIKLKPLFQKLIVEKWFSTNPNFKTFYPSSLIDDFKSETWIMDNSGGKQNS
jgi:hypothetical protein